MDIIIEKCVAALEAHDDAYYNGAPTISDAEYDFLRDKLRKLAPGHPYFARVGAAAPASGAWRKVPHGAPMGSLDKVTNPAEMRAWVASVPLDTDIVVCDKLDGASLSLRYEGGKLVRAVTRGDGTVGEDITRNVLMMKGVPHRLAVADCHVRAEVVVLRSDFAQHFKGESNPRNTANGAMKRQSDPEPCRHLTVIAYEVIPDGEPLDTKMDEFAWLVDEGFRIPRLQRVAGDPSEIAAAYARYIAETRASLDYDIDGLVLYVDDNAARAALGETSGRPKGAVAYKFPADRKETVLREVRWQVGGSGRITPVAVFDEVVLAGARVKQATLHNVAYIAEIYKEEGSTAKHWPAEGDRILTSRRGDVIPAVEALVRAGTGTVFRPPTECPSCGYDTVMLGEYLVCPNAANCDAQISGAIKRWIGKLDVKDFGDAIVEALCASGKVAAIPDLYRLEYADIAKLQFSGRKCGLATATTALDNLREKMQLPLNVLVGSLGIPLWSRSMCKVLVDAGFDTLDKMLAATEADLGAIAGVGETKAVAFVEGLAAMRGTIEALLGAGITVKAPSVGKLSGATVCMTGFRDAAMAAAIEAAGGAIKSGVVKGLTYLVAKNTGGSSGKLDKARASGTRVVSIEEMRAILDDATRGVSP